MRVKTAATLGGHSVLWGTHSHLVIPLTPHDRQEGLLKFEEGGKPSCPHSTAAPPASLQPHAPPFAGLPWKSLLKLDKELGGDLLRTPGALIGPPPEGPTHPGEGTCLEHSCLQASQAGGPTTRVNNGRAQASSSAERGLPPQREDSHCTVRQHRPGPRVSEAKRALFSLQTLL